MKQYNIFLDSAQINCRSNNIILNKLYKYFEKNGHSITKKVSDADFFIINTCGYDKIREKRSLKLIKKYNKKGKVISLGCLNKINQKALENIGFRIHIITDLDELDPIFCSNIMISDIKDAYLDAQINNYFQVGKNFPLIKCSASVFSLFFKRSELFNKMYNEMFRKNKSCVEISKGCTGNCSYCTIKKARGDVISRQKDDIIKDIRKFYNPKNSLTLVADDCASYGVDIGTNLPSLIKEIDNEFPNTRYDICYINPIFLVKQKQEYIDMFRNHNINGANISMQSGSNSIIKRMNRHYDVKQVIQTIKEIRNISPRTFFWTHVIVGFPGETFKDYLKTLSMLNNFDVAMIYAYSDREGTKSSGFKNKNSFLNIHLKFILAMFYTRSRALLKIIIESLRKGK